MRAARPITTASAGTALGVLLLGGCAGTANESVSAPPAAPAVVAAAGSPGALSASAAARAVVRVAAAELQAGVPPAAGVQRRGQPPSKPSRPAVGPARPGDTAAPARPPRSTAGGTTFAVTATPALMPVRDAPGGRVMRTLRNPGLLGAPLTFLQLERRAGWLKVSLPVRPNGSTGWVRADQVTVRAVPWRLVIDQGAHALRLHRDGRLVRTYPVGVGRGSTPTPVGTFYLQVLVATGSPDGAYGPYAFGLSGFSDVLTSFNGGDGVIGLHGTNQPGSVGQDVSHGCIRMYNADITQLARLLPLGTPVQVLP